MKLKRLCRGRLSVSNSAKNGRQFHCLQYRRKTKHVSKYIPATELEAYREATENYRLFMEAVDAYIEELSAQTAGEIRKEAKSCKKDKGLKSASRSLPQGASTSAKPSLRND